MGGKAKEGTEIDTGIKKERDEAKEEAQITRLATVATSDTRAWLEDDMAKVRDGLAVAEEAKRKAEDETARPVVERTSLLLELGVEKDEVSSLQSQASKDKEAMEEDY